MAPMDKAPVDRAPVDRAAVEEPDARAKRPSDFVLERLLALHPKIIDLSLGRIERLLDRLGHPEHRVAPVVHVAGTNGKGSTLAFLRAILEAAGYRVQAYTSPHLVRFAERIRLARGIVTEERLTALLEECERANGGEPITFFEITTAAAFLGFAREAADALLLEVGLGGRLDATNVIARPALSVIAPVSIDHTQYLGDTIEAIAFEKAGILKPGVAAAIGPQAPGAMGVIEREAEQRGAPLYRFGTEWRIEPHDDGLRYEGRRWRLDLPRPNLLGAHQVLNAGLAVAAAEKLDGFKIVPEHVAAGLTHAEWPARLQRLTRGPLVDALPSKEWELWLDGGHNAAAGLILADEAERWRREAPRAMPLGLVYGMLKTKDAEGFLGPLAPFAAALRAIAVPGEQASLSADEAAQHARKAGFKAEAAPDALSAVRELAAALPGPARILICGSLYLAGKVLAENG
ncbi:MAG TPA: folylpolyglutamate synthase/dihydrofolate synthase family protein [Alphaproteobacteria bacterium]|nr:folylpolyglutamate synthase/dihydrofolate synthase family protein [Alphaproteobacteria bacterium]